MDERTHQAWTAEAVSGKRSAVFWVPGFSVERRGRFLFPKKWLVFFLFFFWQVLSGCRKKTYVVLLKPIVLYKAKKGNTLISKFGSLNITFITDNFQSAVDTAAAVPRCTSSVPPRKVWLDHMLFVEHEN